jgi:hypothetical protein
MARTNPKARKPAAKKPSAHKPSARKATAKKAPPGKKPARKVSAPPSPKLLGDYLGAYSDQARKEFGRFYSPFGVTLPAGLNSLIRRNRGRILETAKKAAKPPARLSPSLDVRALAKVSWEAMEDWVIRLDEALTKINEALARELHLRVVLVFNDHPDATGVSWHLEHNRNGKQQFWGTATDKLVEDLLEYLHAPRALLDHLVQKLGSSVEGMVDNIQFTFDD